MARTRVREDQQEESGGATLAVRRTEVIDILTGGVIARFLQRGVDPGPDGSRNPSNSAASGQIPASE